MTRRLQSELYTKLVIVFRSSFKDGDNAVIGGRNISVHLDHHTTHIREDDQTGLRLSGSNRWQSVVFSDLS